MNLENLNDSETILNGSRTRGYMGRRVAVAAKAKVEGDGGEIGLSARDAIQTGTQPEAVEVAVDGQAGVATEDTGEVVGGAMRLAGQSVKGQGRTVLLAEDHAGVDRQGRMRALSGGLDADRA